MDEKIAQNFAKMLVKFSSKIVKKSSFLGAEWTYLLITRKVAGDDSAFSYVRIQYGSNPTDTVTGAIIYPDDFSFADAGVGAMPFGANYPVRQIDADEWEALENVGCVFMPGNRYMSFDSGVLQIGREDAYPYPHYWSATAHDKNAAYDAGFNIPGRAVFLGNNSRFYFFNVRLVQDY